MSSIIITKSSAGSGKTHNLAIRYLQVLLSEYQQNKQPDLIKHILAITFTRKATAEMRQRILDWMKGIYFNAPSPLKNSFIEFIKTPVNVVEGEQTKQLALIDKISKSDIQKYISFAIEHIMQYLDDLKISTIDSFTVFLLRGLAFKLQLPPDFEVSLDETNYQRNIMDELYQDIVDDDETLKIFEKYIEEFASQTPDSFTWNMRDKIFKNVIQLWEKEYTTGKPIEVEKERFVFNLTKLKKFYNKLLEKKTANPDILWKSNFLKGLEKAIERNNLTALSTWVKKKFDNPGKTDSFFNKNSSLPSDTIIKEWLIIKKELTKHFESLSRFRVEGVFGIYELFKKKINSLKSNQDRNIVIQELNSLLQEILKSGNVLPELYYYISEKYKHYLIDEFQDTSSLQWENIEQLLMESFSTGGSLFVVGDMKQAIYRWRGGDASIVNAIQKNVRHHRYPVENLYELKLATNYRSAKKIVESINVVFTYDKIRAHLVSETEGVSISDENRKLLSVYKEAQSLVFEENLKKQGYVYFEIISQLNDGGKETLNKEKSYEIIKQKLINNLEGLLNHYEYKDIAILCRKNDDIETVVQWLLELKNDSIDPKFKNLQINSERTVNLVTHNLTQELIAFLQFIESPSDNLSFLKFLNGDIFHSFSDISEDDIVDWYTNLLIDYPNRLLYLDFKKWKNKEWNEYIDFFFERASYLPLYELVQIIFHKWKILKNFKDDAPYFLKLLEVVLSLSENGINSISEFIEYFEDDENSEQFILQVPDNLNAIKLMTIHKAKGLEFPVTILPFLDSPKKPSNTFLYENKNSITLYSIEDKDTHFSEKLFKIYKNDRLRENIDDINTLYVGLTRASDVLIGYFLSYQNTTKYKEIFKASLEFKDNIYENGQIPKNENTKDNNENNEQSTEFSIVLQSDISWFQLIKTKVRSVDEIFKKDSLELGKAVHDILSQIIHYSPDILEPISQKIAKQYRISTNVLEEKIRQFFDNRKFLHFFQLPNEVIVKNECEVLTSKNQVKRIDKLIIYPDKIQILDFKTGEEYSVEHKNQLTEYYHIIEEIYPDKLIECFLLYLDENKLVEVNI